MTEAQEQFGDVQVYTGQEIAQAQQTGPPAQSAAGGIEQSRAVAEAQAAMVVAKMNQRNEIKAYDRIIHACKRKSLAERATYAYKRGGQLVTGPSIRLAEVLARNWGNLTFGLRELDRKNGSSEMEAYAWDLETNTRVSRSFTVKHIRERKQGNVNLDSERDIYELTANMGQRRVRACILELIPGDIVEAAEEQCKKTLEAGDGQPMEDRIRKMVAAFSEQGVTQEMIENFLGHKVEAMVPQQLVRLTEIYRSIRDGIGTREDFFKINFTNSQQGQTEQSKEPEKPSAAPTQKEQQGKQQTSEVAFRNEWIKMRSSGYAPYVRDNLERFRQASEKLLTEARGKWKNLYGNDEPFPLDGQEESQPEGQQGSQYEPEPEGTEPPFEPDQPEKSVFQQWDEIQQKDEAGAGMALEAVGFDNEPGNEQDLKKCVDVYHKILNQGQTQQAEEQF